MASASTQVAGLQWTFQYSGTDFSGLTVSTGQAALAAGKSITCNANIGQATCVVAGLNSNAIAPGVVATATFTLASSTTSTLSTVQLANSLGTTPDGQPIAVAASGGTVNITQPEAPAVSMLPESGFGGSQTFTLTASGGNSVSQITVLLNRGLALGGGCEIRYDRPANTIYLQNDSGTAWLGPATAGSAGTLQNTQCLVSLPGASASVGGNLLTVTVPVTFRAAFAGPKSVYMNATYTSGQSTGFQQVGAWTVTGGVVAPPVSPALYFTNEASRQIAVWYMGGAGSVSTALLLGGDPVAPGWQLTGAADFDGNGAPDLLWQHTGTLQIGVWYMGGPEGQARLSAQLLNGGSPVASGWRLAGAADFDGNGTPDLLWQHTGTLQIGVWYMGGAQGASRLSAILLNDGIPVAPGWQLAGAADLDRNGTPDLLWLHTGNGQIGVWFMGGAQGAVRLSAILLNDGIPVAPGWQLAGAAEVDGSGTPDLLWQHTGNGQLGVWYMGGAQGASRLYAELFNGGTPVQAGWQLKASANTLVPVGPQASLPGIQTGPAPWAPELSLLAQRLEIRGLRSPNAGGNALHARQHLDVFINGERVEVPAFLGLIGTAGFLSPIHSHDNSGIIHVESDVVRPFTLGHVFDAWGLRLDSRCIGAHCALGLQSLRVYVNGVLSSGNPRDLVLADHQEIAVVFGTDQQRPNPIPSSYNFGGP